ncbi:MAG: hypothetical protein M1812_003012 [Candelaria pacifica]|nr:MAG: hypothetical protein M1812_003012 [Candelaria pacifica]
MTQSENDIATTNTKANTGVLLEATKTPDGDIEPWTVEKKLAILHILPKSHSSSPVPFFHLLERLKTTKRAGWERFQIYQGESISDHMYRMSLLTMFAPPSLASRIKIPHCTKMALVHDMAESIVGDITPMDGISKMEKSKRETMTMDYLCSSLLGNVGGGMIGSELRQVWQEYEEGQTLEARYVHDIDKMELILQMLEYEKKFNGKVDLDEFKRVEDGIKLPEVRLWCKEVLDDRKQFWNDLGREQKGKSGTGAKPCPDEYLENGAA